MKLLVLASHSSQVLYQYGWQKKNENKLMQLVTPILVSQRILQEELQTSIQEIRLGAHLIMLSRHHLQRYTLIVQGK